MILKWLSDKESNEKKKELNKYVCERREKKKTEMKNFVLSFAVSLL